MSAKSKIKIIKKGTPTVEKKREKTKPVNSARELVNNVSNWVSDFQQRKSEETKKAIDLFLASPQPNSI